MFFLCTHKAIYNESQSNKTMMLYWITYPGSELPGQRHDSLEINSNQKKILWQQRCQILPGHNPQNPRFSKKTQISFLLPFIWCQLYHICVPFPASFSLIDSASSCAEFPLLSFLWYTLMMGGLTIFCKKTMDFWLIMAFPCSVTELLWLVMISMITVWPLVLLQIITD